MRRPAVTLIEALMAIFVMAIGLLALLTLFPLGAIQMAQALKDQRSTETANQAASMFKALQLSADASFAQPQAGATLNVTTSPIPGTGGGNNTVGTGQLSVFQDPWPQAAYPNAPWPQIQVGPGYPLFVDPYNWAFDSATPATQRAVGLPPPGFDLVTGVFGIRRATLSHPLFNPASATAQSLQRWCTLQDDINFTDNGLPADLGSPLQNSNVIQREGRYSYALMVRRANANSADLPLDLTVVVYASRQTGLDVNNNPIGETTFPKAQFISDRVIYLPIGGVVPNGQNSRPTIRRGSWLLDARMAGSDATPPGGATAIPQGYFYRVVNVTQANSAALGDYLELEVQSPGGGAIRNNLFGLNPVTNAPYTGPVIVMENVSEVFEKGTNY